MAEVKTGGSVESVVGSKTFLVTDDVTFGEKDYWERRTRLEKILIIFGVVFFITSVGLLAALIVNMKSEQVSPEICMTEQCVQTASELSKKLNKDVKPCEDMYGFACGGWIKSNVIPENRGMHGPILEMVDRLSLAVKVTLEKDKTSSEPNVIHKAKDLYTSCTDLGEIEEMGVKPMTDYLEKLGGWPVLDANWNESNFDLLNLLVSLNHDNIKPIIKLEVDEDNKNTSADILYIDQPSFGIPGQKYYQRGRNDTTLMTYENMAVKVAVALGADPSRAKKEMKDIVDLEYVLASISVSEENRTDLNALYNKRSIKEMSQIYSDFDWLKYVENTLALKGVNIPVTENQPVVDKSPFYFQRLFPVLERASKRQLGNYVMWIMMASNIKHLNEKFRIIYQDYRKVLYGSVAQTPRWEECSTYVNVALPMAVARMYVGEYFDEKAKTSMLEMVANLRATFQEMLQENNWMDSATKSAAKEKADVMREKIGYPDNIKQDKYINDLYADYVISKAKYFENVVAVSRQKAVTNLRKLREAQDRTMWKVRPAVVNAYYDPHWNEILFPAGILQPPFFNKHQPQSLNYGAIGYVIGHEITHGFDNKGRQADKDGNLNQWWSDDVVAKFQERAQCFVEQYSNYTLTEAKMNINGILTLGENIADNGGMKESYRAYRKWVSKRGQEEPLLPGLPYNNNQLFFISVAQTWCMRMKPQVAIYSILTDTHSPPRFRILGMFHNSKEFSEVFNCPAASYMNPSKKCSLW